MWRSQPEVDGEGEPQDRDHDPQSGSGDPADDDGTEPATDEEAHAEAWASSYEPDGT